MYQIPYYEVPREEEDYRFVQSFSLDSQEEEALEFFNEFGFVVFNGILNEDECQKSVDELFQLCEMKPSDPSTWNHWPKNGMERYGTPTQAPLFSPQLLRNRQNPRLHRAFSLLLKTQDLLINHDRACLMRPVAENPSWATSLSLHLDFNPWNYLSSDHSQLEKAFNELDYSTLAQFIAENNQIVFSPDETPLQGGFNFLDNFEEDGGFIIIPGFNHHFEEWARANSNLSKKSDGHNSYKFTPQDPLQQSAIRVPMRAGSLVIWDQKCAHGSRPNSSHNFRAAQFMKMFPNKISPSRAIKRADVLHRILLKENFLPQITPTGVTVFGLKDSKQFNQTL